MFGAVLCFSLLLCTIIIKTVRNKLIKFCDTLYTLKCTHKGQCVGQTLFNCFAWFDLFPLTLSNA